MSLFNNKNQNQIQNEMIQTLEGYFYESNFNLFKNQNKLLQNQISDTSNIYSTDKQKNYYMNENLMFYKKINYYLLILYYIFVIFIAILIFLSSKFNIYMKTLLIILFFIYPIIIFNLEIFIFNLFRYLYALIRGDVYHRKSFISN